MHRLNNWIESLYDGRLVVIECGAGQAVPTVRVTCQNIARRKRGMLLRINPREPDVPAGHVSLPMRALSALRALDARLKAYAL
jgi:hypothetical protein